MKNENSKTKAQNNKSPKGKPSIFATGVCNPKEPKKPRFVEWSEFYSAYTATASDLERFDAQISRIEKHCKHAAQIYFAATAVSIIALALAGLAVIAANQ